MRLVGPPAAEYPFEAVAVAVLSLPPTCRRCPVIAPAYGDSQFHSRAFDLGLILLSRPDSTRVAGFPLRFQSDISISSRSFFERPAAGSAAYTRVVDWHARWKG